jgi:hypothetical protein
MDRNVVAYQGYMAESMAGFNFLEDYRLSNYHDKKAPVVIFGGHYNDTLRVLAGHEGIAIIQWQGADSTRARKQHHLYTKPNVINVACTAPVQQRLIDTGINCYLTKRINHKPPNPLIKGNKIYTYIHQNDEQKYGRNALDKIRTPYEVLIARLNIPKHEWYGGKCDEFYSQCFIGLALSSFAGGCYSTLEMGLRGIKVVTNVMVAPHCIPWETTEDVEKAILQEAKTIGTADKEMARKVYDSMEHECTGFDLNKLLI